jgi:hypothetical protein
VLLAFVSFFFMADDITPVFFSTTRPCRDPFVPFSLKQSINRQELRASSTTYPLSLIVSNSSNQKIILVYKP